MKPKPFYENDDLYHIKDMSTRPYKSSNRFLFWRFLFCAAVGFFLAAIVVKVFYEVLLKLF